VVTKNSIFTAGEETHGPIYYRSPIVLITHAYNLMPYYAA
jgi:hypothetical protein